MSASERYKMRVEENRRKGLPYPNHILDGNRVIVVGIPKADISNGFDAADTSYRKLETVCNYLEVIKIQNNVTTKEKTVVLKYFNKSNAQEEKEVAAEILADKQKIVSLSKYGIDVNSLNSAGVIRHIENELRKAGETKVISKIGMVNYDGEDYYIGERSLIFTDEKILKEALEYQGKLNIGCKGDFDEYMKMLRKEVVPSVFLSTALAIGASSLLVGYIGKQVNISNLLFHLSGDSSTGKTTALWLAVTVHGDVASVPDKTSLLSTFNSTDNALFELLSDNYGVAIGIDEAGMSKDKSFASLIYRLVEGKEKSRLEYGVGNKDVREWRTAIITTGEIPLQDYTDRATGQGVRVINFESTPWTDSAVQSDRIKKTLLEHNGFLSERIGRYLLKKGRKVLVKAHDGEMERIKGMLSCGNLNSRVANQLAMVTLATKILGKIQKVKLPLNVTAIRRFLVAVANDTIGADYAIGERAYEKMKAEISKKQNQIEIRNRNGHPVRSIPVGDLWGVCTLSSSISAPDVSKGSYSFPNVSIPKTEVDKFLLDNGFKNPEIIYMQWRDGKRIETDKRGGILFKVRLGAVASTNCIRILL